jgi:hypothetical protein
MKRLLLASLVLVSACGSDSPSPVSPTPPPPAPPVQVNRVPVILNWLTERGLSIRQAREFVKAGLDRWDLDYAMRQRFAQGR